MKTELILGNSVEVLKTLVDPVDVIVTSPPYKDCDGYTDDLMKAVFSGCFNKLKSGGLFFLNFGHLAEEKFRPFRVCQIALDCGFRLNETIVWAKNHFTPLRGPKRLNNLTEFIFLLYKDSMPDLDRLSIGVPYKDVSNAKRYNNGVNLRCQGNLWHIDYPTVNKSEQKLHKDMFPLQLPLNCLKLSGIKNGVVLDVFSGSGTTGEAAKLLGLNYIGIESNPHYHEIAKKRLGYE